MPKSVRRQVQDALSYVRSETSDDLKSILQLAKETDARSRVMFQKIHNLAVEVAGLEIAVKGLCGTLLELCKEPESIHHAEAIVRDFLIKLHKQ